MSLQLGEVFEGFFEIEENTGLDMEGYIYSSSVRMQLGVDSFHGAVAAIPYEFNTDGMQPGDVLKGNIMIVSNMGEYVLPFVATVGFDVLESSMGSIKNLFHFTNLAKTNWDEAVRIFSSPHFIDIMTGNDAKFRNLYIGLSERGNKNYSLEEFLIGINKKQMVEYTVDRESIRVSEPQGDVRQSIAVERNGWGYTLLAVKAEGDFIELSTNRLEERDFESNVCHFDFIIHENKLHGGKNFGKITFKSLYSTVSVDITVVNTIAQKTAISLHKKKSVKYSLVRHYIDFITKKMPQTKWLSLAEELVNHRALAGSDDLENALYQTHILLMQERFNEAKWLLDHKIVDDIEEASNELYCYYLYLMTLYNVDDYYTREVNDRIQSIYEKDPENWRVAWILMRTNDEFKRNPSRLYAFAIKQLERGCASPIFYAEIIRELNSVPSLLVHFDDDEKRLLLYASKNHLVGNALQGQIAYHAARQRNFDERTLKMLCYLYEGLPTDDVLQAICSQLMKGDLIGEKYFKWYELGIQKNLQVTKLYENYMLSLNTLSDHPIPRDVLMYFSYQSDLPVEKNAYIYAYVVKNKDTMPEMYNLYLDSMSRFVAKQLYAGKITRDLAYLYQEIIMKEMATVDNIRQFAKLLLVHCIRVNDPNIVSVVVMDERLKDEIVYPVVNGMSYVTLFSSDYTLLLIDKLGNRYYHTKEYSTERYFLPRKLLPKIEKYTEDSLLFDLYICEGNMDYITVTERNVGRFMYLEQSEHISEKFRSKIRMPLIRYYLDRDDTLNVDAILGRLTRADVPYNDRDELIKILLNRGYLDTAYDYAKYFGPEAIDPQILVRLATAVIDRDGMAQEQFLTGFIVAAFEKKKYNETVLTYLVRFYKGLAKNLRNIWRAASGFYVDTYSVCEALILQTLITGAYIGEEAKILKQYVDGGAKTDVELRYLTYFAHEYFVRERVVDEYMFTEMARVYENEGELPIVCMLAFLKYYATDAATQMNNPDIREHICRYIHVLYSGNGIMMPFMKEFASISIEAAEIAKLTLVEYHGEEGSHVMLNYNVTMETDRRQGYIREEMTHVYGGVFVKSFLLFFGEALQYYITENYGDMEQLTESGTISRSDAQLENDADRYAMVNDIAIAATLKDCDTALELLEEYKYKEYLVENLFHKQ